MSASMSGITISGRTSFGSADPMGYFQITGTYTTGTGLVLVSVFTRGNWNPGAVPGSTSSLPTFLGPSLNAPIPTFYIPCSQGTYLTVKTQIYLQTLYGNYDSNITTNSPSPGSPVQNGIGGGGYLQWTFTGATTHIANVGWIQL